MSTKPGEYLLAGLGQDFLEELHETLAGGGDEQWRRRCHRRRSVARAVHLGHVLDLVRVLRPSKPPCKMAVRVVSAPVGAIVNSALH